MLIIAVLSQYGCGLCIYWSTHNNWLWFLVAEKKAVQIFWTACSSAINHLVYPCRYLWFMGSWFHTAGVISYTLDHMSSSLIVQSTSSGLIDLNVFRLVVINLQIRNFLTDQYLHQASYLWTRHNIKQGIALVLILGWWANPQPPWYCMIHI